MPYKTGLMILAGIDEAGRGPVIGPMVMAIAVIDEKAINKLVEIGVKDSKLLSSTNREAMFELIKSALDDHKIIILSPQEIDEALNHPTMNLNWLEAETSAKLISQVKCDKVIVDSPSNNINAYKNYLINKLPTKVDVVAEHKADMKFPIVAAASILAKVIRDREIEKIKQKYAIEFGSGYPSDPLTVEFLKQNYDKYPEIFRKTWISYKRLASKSQTTLDKFK